MYYIYLYIYVLHVHTYLYIYVHAYTYMPIHKKYMHYMDAYNVGLHTNFVKNGRRCSEYQESGVVVFFRNVLPPRERNGNISIAVKLPAKNLSIKALTSVDFD